ncbi:MAG: N-acetylmuramoyl-L-alanine amidase [Candidatus Sericytochromatia bacterium]
MKKAFFKYILLPSAISLAACFSAFSQELILSDVNFDNNSKTINIVASKDVKAEMFKVDDPPRTVIDLQGAVYYPVTKKIDINNDTIKQIRVSQFQNDPPIVRVTIETNKNTDFNLNNILEKDSQNIKLTYPHGKKETKPTTLTIDNKSISKYKKTEEEKTATAEYAKNPASNLITVDFKESDTSTKVFIYAKENVVYKYFTLDNPDRFVVDTYGTSVEQINDIFSVKQSKNVQKVRFGAIEKTDTTPEGVRVVFELKNKVLITDNKKSDKSLAFALVKDKNAVSVASNTVNTPNPTSTQIVTNTYTNSIKPKLNGKYLVVVDAGHGGPDPGAIGPSKIQEKDVTLAVSYYLSKMLKDNGIGVLMARGDDSDIDLQPRVDVANNNNADLFVSIHCNALDGNSPSGIETYYRTPQSLDFGKIIHKNVVQGVGTPDRGLRGDRNLFVIRKTTMPSVLIEIGYITNPTEEANLSNSAHQKKIAQSIYKGIKEYLGKYSQANR